MNWGEVAGFWAMMFAFILFGALVAGFLFLTGWVGFTLIMVGLVVVLTWHVGMEK